MHDDLQKRKPKVTLSIHILRQEHGSWQGEIQWLEGNCSRMFRSALELIMLIDNACEISEKEYEKKAVVGNCLNTKSNRTIAKAGCGGE